MVPNLGWFDLRFFSFLMVQKQYIISRDHGLNFHLFPGYQNTRHYSALMLGSDSDPQSPTDHMITKTNTDALQCTELLRCGIQKVGYIKCIFNLMLFSIHDGVYRDVTNDKLKNICTVWFNWRYSAQITETKNSGCQGLGQGGNWKLLLNG